MTKIPQTSYTKNCITGASRNRLMFDRGFVHFKSGTPLAFRTPFLTNGGENLSRYKTYVFYDRKNNTLNMRINEINTTINKVLCKLGLIKKNNIKRFPMFENTSIVQKDISEFISTNAIHEFMSHSSLKKKFSKIFSLIV